MTNMLRTNIYFSLLLLTVLNVQAVLGQSVTVVVPGGPCPNGAEYEFGFDDTGCPDCTVVGWSITGSPTSYNHGSTITARWSAAGTYHVTAKFRTSVNNTVYFSQPFPVTIFPPSTPRLTLTSSPPYLIKTDVTYSTDPSKSDYVWTVVGVLNTDYIKVSGGLSSSRNITIRWLTPGSKTVRVRYTDTGSCATNTSSVTHSFAIRPPEAPRNLVATRTSASQINLTWTDASDDETSFEIERSLTDAEGFTPLATVSAGTATYASTGLTFSTRYFYRVRAVNAGGPSAYCDEANARTYPADGGIRRPLNDLAYEYKYDFRNRMIAKKVPGAGWVYMVYDKRDRLVMTQDGNQRTENKWSFTKYDALNRPVITGIYTHADPVSQAVMSSFISTTQLWETYNGNAATHGYTNDVFPRAGTILTVTYYDTYAFRDNLIGGTDYNYKSDELEGQLPAAYASVIGQVTGTKVNVLNTTNYLWTVNYYDDKYRVVQTTSSNQKSGYDRITTVLDFPGNPLKTRTTHCINGATCTSVIRRFEYGHAMRLTKTWHKADENDEVLLTENEYDELGQLVTKKLHSEDANTFKQHVDYRYNIRGWLTRINNSDLSNNSDSGPRDFFGMNLAYNENIGGIAIPSPQFNGNISATTWSTNLGLGISALSQPTEKAYTFNYDPLNRLTGAVTQEKVTGWNSSNEFHENNLSYDLNGNILKLSRRGSQGVLMDSLMYDYGAGTAKSNKLLKVTDAGDAVKGFIEGTHTGNDYAYDNNGNMTHDLNKQIGSVLADATNRITYNHLNLPEKVQKNNGEKMINVYDAAGRKLRQQVYDSSGVVTKTTDYIGEFFYENDTLRFINHQEGRIVPQDGGMTYEYHLKDHLGNVRLTFTTKEQLESDSAGFEDADIADEQAGFNPSYNNAVKVSAPLYNHTPGGNKSQRLSAANENEIIGLAKSLKVIPGDTIHMEVYAKYTAPTSTGTDVGDFILGAISTAFGVSASSTGIGELAYQRLTAMNSLGLLINTGPDVDETAPKAYLNYILFDEDFVPYDFGFDQISTNALETGTNISHEKLMLTAVVRVPGYAYIYLSNESNTVTDVYFDDLKITNRRSPVIQADDYYPFGLRFNSYSRENSVPNKTKLFQGQEHIDDLGLNWDSFKWRNHQPDIGRFFNVDPLSEKYYYNSPYAFSENKVVVHRELEGLESVYIFDQQNNPANKKVYNARVYVEQPNGKVSGPYRGSSYPNHPDSQTKHNTVNSGKHLYNNKDGHHRGQSNEQKGLNIVDGNGSRTNTPGKDVNGKSVTMENVNIHSGQPLDNNNQHNRGSAGCPTIHPSDAAGFFSNFDWSSGNGHRGNSEGVVTIYKGESTSSELMESNLQFKQTQEFQEVNNPTAKSDNTGSQLQTRTPNGDAKANPAQIFVLQNIFNGNYTP